jgi:hypothetical protein
MNQIKFWHLISPTGKDILSFGWFTGETKFVLPALYRGLGHFF